MKRNSLPSSVRPQPILLVIDSSYQQLLSLFQMMQAQIQEDWQARLSDKKTRRPGWVTIEKLLEDERLENENKEHVKQTTAAKQISKMGSGEPLLTYLDRLEVSFVDSDIIFNTLFCL